jgi:phospholipid transport system substrate-binding protein
MIAIAMLLLGRGAEAAAARDVIERFNTTLLKVMQDADDLGYAGRYRVLAPVIGDSFNLAFMAREAAGSYWQSLSDAERASLADAFARFTIATYAARFNRYSGQKFTIVGEAAGLRDTAVVRNRITKASGETVDIDYALRQDQERWRIVDVYLKGRVSELAVRRSEYTTIIRNQGFTDLIAGIESRIKALTEEKSPSPPPVE